MLAHFEVSLFIMSGRIAMVTSRCSSFAVLIGSLHPFSSLPHLHVHTSSTPSHTHTLSIHTAYFRIHTFIHTPHLLTLPPHFHSHPPHILHLPPPHPQRTSFYYNPALQSCSFLMQGVISQRVSMSIITRTLKVLEETLGKHEDEIMMLEAIVICLTRMVPLLNEV